MFLLLPNKTLIFVLLCIPALIASYYALIPLGWLTKLKVDKNDKSKISVKKYYVKKVCWTLLAIILLAAEVGAAYLYPASFIDDRGYRGDGTFFGYNSSNTTNNSNGDSSNSNKWFSFKKSKSYWDVFEKSNRIGDSYKSISSDYTNLIESGYSDGGILLQANDSLYFSFPVLNKSDISDMTQCTGMTGTMEELFGCKEDITVEDFKQNLGLTSETVFEGNLNYKKTAASGYYYILIRDVDIEKASDVVTTKTWISVIQRNRAVVPVGRYASDQEATEATVYYVQEGDCYHQTPSCSTLHDSDTIYECYIDDVPEGRTQCGVCH